MCVCIHIYIYTHISTHILIYPRILHITTYPACPHLSLYPHPRIRDAKSQVTISSSLPPHIWVVVEDTWGAPQGYIRVYRDTAMALWKLGDPNIDRKILRTPYPGGPQKGTPNFGKPPYICIYIYISIYIYRYIYICIYGYIYVGFRL